MRNASIEFAVRTRGRRRLSQGALSGDHRVDSFFIVTLQHQLGRRDDHRMRLELECTMSASSSFPNDDNGQVLQSMHERGDDLKKARDIDFCFVFPDRTQAVAFIQQVPDKTVERAPGSSRASDPSRRRA
jgi:hypothetical protein